MDEDRGIEPDDIVADIETSLGANPDPGCLTTVYPNGVIEVATGEVARTRASASRFSCHYFPVVQQHGPPPYSCCCSCG